MRKISAGICRYFGKDNFFLEIQNHQIPEEAKANKGLISLAQKYDLKLVATNDIHYIKKKTMIFMMYFCVYKQVEL